MKQREKNTLESELDLNLGSVLYSQVALAKLFNTLFIFKKWNVDAWLPYREKARDTDTETITVPNTLGAYWRRDVCFQHLSILIFINIIVLPCYCYCEYILGSGTIVLLSSILEKWLQVVNCWFQYMFSKANWCFDLGHITGQW